MLSDMSLVNKVEDELVDFDADKLSNIFYEFSFIFLKKRNFVEASKYAIKAIEEDKHIVQAYKILMTCSMQSGMKFNRENSLKFQRNFVSTSRRTVVFVLYTHSTEFH